MKNEYEIRGDVTAIFINSKKYGRQETLISTSDLERVKETFHNTWCVNYSVCTKTLYVTGRYYSQKVLLHRFIMEPKGDKVVDHINHDTLNNARKNLRVVTQSKNLKNINPIKIRDRKKPSSGHKYIYRHSNRWVIMRKTKKKIYYGGRFKSLTDAVEAMKKIDTR